MSPYPQAGACHWPLGRGEDATMATSENNTSRFPCDIHGHLVTPPNTHSAHNMCDWGGGGGGKGQQARQIRLPVDVVTCRRLCLHRPVTCGGADCISQVYRVHCRGRLHWTNSPCIHRHTNTHHKALYPPSQTHKHTPQNTVPTLTDTQTHTTKHCTHPHTHIHTQLQVFMYILLQALTNCLVPGHSNSIHINVCPREAFVVH